MSNLIELRRKSLQRAIDPAPVLCEAIRELTKGSPISFISDPDQSKLATGFCARLGIGTYVLQELILIEEAVLSFAEHRTAVDRLEVFALDSCVGSEVDAYVPGTGNLRASPVFGVWRDGALVHTEWGPTSFSTISQLLGVPPLAVLSKRTGLYPS